MLLLTPSAACFPQLLAAALGANVLVLEVNPGPGDAILYFSTFTPLPTPLRDEAISEPLLVAIVLVSGTCEPRSKAWLLGGLAWACRKLSGVQRRHHHAAGALNVCVLFCTAQAESAWTTAWRWCPGLGTSSRLRSTWSISGRLAGRVSAGLRPAVACCWLLQVAGSLPCLLAG